MSFLTLRPVLSLVCTAFLCTASLSVLADEPVPFPEVVHVEKAENPVEELAETLPWLEQIGYQLYDPNVSRIHNDTYYHVISYTANGDEVQLHDASLWSVHYSYRQTVLRWAQSDNIVIKPYASCFSSCKWVLHNHTQQQIAEVNLISPPLPMGAYTFRIVNIEPYSRMVLLSDNTLWQVDPSDSNFPYWQIGQRVLVGLNNHWRTAPFCNILINVDMYYEPYSQANFYGYPAGY